jgi:hypothetical protein
MRNLVPSALLMACASWLGAAEPESLPAVEADLMQGSHLDAGQDPAADMDLIEAEDSGLVTDGEGALGGPVTVPQKRTTVQFRVTARATYDDNIFIQEKNAKSDLILSVAPGFSLGYGDVAERKDAFIVLSYDATAYFFTDHPNLNSVDHDASLRGQWSGSKLTLGSFVAFHDLTGTNNETADRVNRKLYEAGITATYTMSEVTTLGAELNESVSDYANYLDTQETALRLWADHNVSVLTKVGLGVTLGQVDVSEGSSQTYEQLLLRVNYAAGSKVDLGLQVGGELRQIESGHAQATPVFSLQATYSPYDLLKVRLNGYRRVQPSIIDSGANTVTTGVGLDFSYRFLERFELNAGGAYERAAYESLDGGKSRARTDNYYLLRASLSYALRENIGAGVFYQFRTNDSTASDHSFDNQQVGFDMAVSF